ncbi:hypothetical protein OGAPHI_006990 [Ogataea philodendri]|uniref:Uncharacterized protein n=1 Tax=Ogataea philodendri TaxID=1378263 RepID=A0A9P8NWL8_9ASCO|nr:uncharacterized protein OGAPHI_006990 [Ogataea philodendri]KAH3660404.1 hypothetical protein OGAPHI_006990 [Ogataea philodendri]
MIVLETLTDLSNASFPSAETETTKKAASLSNRTTSLFSLGTWINWETAYSIRSPSSFWNREGARFSAVRNGSMSAEKLTDSNMLVSVCSDDKLLARAVSNIKNRREHRHVSEDRHQVFLGDDFRVQSVDRVHISKFVTNQDFCIVERRGDRTCSLRKRLALHLFQMAVDDLENNNSLVCIGGEDQVFLISAQLDISNVTDFGWSSCARSWNFGRSVVGGARFLDLLLVSLDTGLVLLN